MAGRAQPINPWPGIGAAVAVAALILGALAAVFWRAEGPATLGRADWAAIRFTILQAGLSAAFSVALAVPLAQILPVGELVGQSLEVKSAGRRGRTSRVQPSCLAS